MASHRQASWTFSTPTLSSKFGHATSFWDMDSDEKMLEPNVEIEEIDTPEAARITKAKSNAKAASETKPMAKAATVVQYFFYWR